MPTVIKLRAELGKRGLPTEGHKEDLEQRLADAGVKELRVDLGKRRPPKDGLKADLEQHLGAAEQQAAKRTKTVVISIANRWVCLLTGELMIHPVQAEDGKTYERAAIEKWLEEKRTSPSTGAAMGTHLVSLVQARDTIKDLVENGLVDADKAAAWKQKKKLDDYLEDLRAEADQGGAEAILYTLGYLYHTGQGALRRFAGEPARGSSAARSQPRVGNGGLQLVSSLRQGRPLRPSARHNVSGARGGTRQRICPVSAWRGPEICTLFKRAMWTQLKRANLHLKRANTP